MSAPVANDDALTAGSKSEESEQFPAGRIVSGATYFERLSNLMDIRFSGSGLGNVPVAVSSEVSCSKGNWCAFMVWFSCFHSLSNGDASEAFDFAAIAPRKWNSLTDHAPSLCGRPRRDPVNDFRLPPTNAPGSDAHRRGELALGDCLIQTRARQGRDLNHLLDAQDSMIVQRHAITPNAG